MRVPGGGYVARGVDARDAGAEVLVDGDAVGHGQPGGMCESDMRHDTDADHHDVGRLDGTVAQHDGIDVAVAADLRHAPPETQLDAVVGVQAGEHRRHRRAEHTQQRGLGRLDEHDVGAHRAGRRGDLGPDPAGADDGDATTAPDGVGESPASRRVCAGSARRRARCPARRGGAARRPSPAPRR